jgi:hypothetical protein
MSSLKDELREMILEEIRTRKSRNISLLELLEPDEEDAVEHALQSDSSDDPGFMDVTDGESQVSYDEFSDWDGNSPPPEEGNYREDLDGVDERIVIAVGGIEAAINDKITSDSGNFNMTPQLAGTLGKNLGIVDSIKSLLKRGEDPSGDIAELAQEVDAGFLDGAPNVKNAISSFLLSIKNSTGNNL